MQVLRHKRFRTNTLWRFLITIGICLAVLPQGILQRSRADDANDSADTFATILDRGTRRTIKDVSKYIVEHPDALDVQSAYKWLFQTSLEQELELEALPLARKFLAGDEGFPDSLVSTARQVLCLGLAKSGKTEEGLAVFDRQIQTVRFRTAGNSVGFGFTFATQMRIAGELDAARCL